MPKGERKSNRETRKPKAAKPKAAPRPPSFQGGTLGPTMSGGGGKKKS
jgi:hypothetical protein